MNELKNEVYDQLGILNDRETLKSLHQKTSQEITEVDNLILKLAQKKSYLQADLCNINRQLNKVENILSPKSDE